MSCFCQKLKKNFFKEPQQTHSGRFPRKEIYIKDHKAKYVWMSKKELLYKGVRHVASDF